jgi:hypothetical protein
MENKPSQSLLAWQWAHYGAAHNNRRNLVIHTLTAPLFMLGTLALPAGFLVAWWLVPVGAAVMALAVAAQGSGHAHEVGKPAPFRGALDVLLRIFAEQWITFPRYVVSGRLVAAWRAGA